MFRSFVFLALVLSLPVSGLAGNEESKERSLEELLNTELSSMGALGVQHTHLKGEWMIGYQLMVMSMDGNLDGGQQISPEEVLQDFMVSPTHMRMEMHMFEVMYAPTDDLTLMGMVPYIRQSMDHLTRRGTSFATDSEGLGDVSAYALYTFYRQRNHRIHIDGGVSLPTGSIDERGATPMGPDSKLPYPMQLGSGTFDVLPGIAYLGSTDRFVWGARTGAAIRLGTNDNDYRLGNAYGFTFWGGLKLTDWLSSYVRTGVQTWGNFQGADPELNPRMVPTADPLRRGGTRVPFVLGFNFFQPEGSLKGNRLTLESGWPSQSLEGPQLETDWHMRLAWQWTF